jgi:hypothetical protein
MMVFILFNASKKRSKMIVCSICVVGKEWCNPKISSTNFPQIVSNQFVGTLHGVHCNFNWGALEGIKQQTHLLF